jgi:hypothetical protein
MNACCQRHGEEANSGVLLTEGRGIGKMSSLN